MSQQFTSQQQRALAAGLQVVAPSGRVVTIGPEGAAAIRREAINRGSQILDALHEGWQELETADEQQPVEPQFEKYMQKLIGQLPKTLHAVSAFTPRDQYTERANWQADTVTAGQ
jgi:hypothetical protein